MKNYFLCFYSWKIKMFVQTSTHKSSFSKRVSGFITFFLQESWPYFRYYWWQTHRSHLRQCNQWQQGEKSREGRVWVLHWQASPLYRSLGKVLWEAAKSLLHHIFLLMQHRDMFHFQSQVPAASNPPHEESVDIFLAFVPPQGLDPVRRNK